MLSIENHQPADQHEISLKGVVDPSNPSLDDHKTCTKFSIRDYVFSTRSQNIKTNWPFSEKNLQLCLKHGVKDILPPFQCLHCVKYQRDSVESSSSEEGKIINSVTENPTQVGSINLSVESSSSGKGKIINSDMETVNKVRNIDLSGSESCDKKLPVTTDGSPREVFPKTSEKSKSHFAKRTENSKPSSIKKCKLVVKVGPSKVESGSNLNIASSMVEPMAASKVCPVCKNFSSSSNTTLNAHIDQCLSMDSPIEPSSKSKVIKHRIKPRKMRLMVDIYATAPHCTLEELDRRNGRIWNEIPSLPTIQEDTVDCDEEKKQSLGSDEKVNECAVYVDASGTKLRILNKIGDTSPVSKLGVNLHQLDEPLRKDKGRKLLTSYKKKKKHNKFLKLASQTEKTRYYKTRLASRVLEDHENKDESTEKDENVGIDVAQSSKFREQMSNSRTIIPNWASSKGSDLLKRRFESEKPSLHDSYFERSYGQKNLNCDVIPYASHQKGKGKDNSSSESPVNKYHEQPPLKKHMGFKPVRSLSFTSVDRTFSSSREQMLSVDHAPKFGKSKSFRASNGHGYNQKNIEHQRRIDEEVGQVPLERSNIFKIKKKSPSVICHGAESRQDHDNREIPPPSVGEPVEDKFVNVEPPRGGEIGMEQSLVDDFGNVMNLAKSFDQDFYSIGNTDMETEMSPSDEERNYFSGIDPITIPGPPGSFLPSPGRMSSDEDRQGSSSLTTSQVQSSMDHLEMVDRDWSYSPKSANSTVSNSLLARSDLKLTENLSLEAHVPQNEIISLGLSDEITKSTLVFHDGQPRSSPKEGISVNNEESQLLKRRVVMSTSPVPTADKQSSYYLNSTGFPVAESGVGPVSVKVPVKPPFCGDFGSPSPSSPNHVLRLMGKNLLVVNNDEDLNHSPNSKFHAGHLDNHAVHQVTHISGYKGMEMDLHEQKPTFGSFNRSISMPFSPLRYNKTERVEILTGTMQRNEESSVHKHRKDVIIIDDNPENEVHTNGMNVNQTSYGGFPIPLSGYYNSRHINPFHCYQGPDFSPYGGPRMIPNTSSPMPPPCLGPMRWNNSVVESSMLSPSSLTSSPATKRARSSLYYSPSMS